MIKITVFANSLNGAMLTRTRCCVLISWTSARVTSFYQAAPNEAVIAAVEGTSFRAATVSLQ